jgi:hypothetical protein
MHGVDIGNLQGDVAPAACLTNRIDACGAVFLKKNEAVAQAKGRTARPGLLGKAEGVAIEPKMFAEAADSHGDGDLGDAIISRRHQLNTVAVGIDHPLWHACACVEPGTAPKATIPINKVNTRSFITSLANGAKVKAGQPITIKGFAFDGGEGIKEVELSIDGGKTWQQAKLGKDFGKYSFREWQLAAMLLAGPHELMVRATNNAGATQSAAATWNPAGYMRNVIETTTVTAA